MATKTANLYARIEPDVKNQAESILEELGIPASSAITMFYKQIILHRGLPFDVKLPPQIVNMSKLTKDELDAEIIKGYEDMVEGRVIDSKDAFSQLRKKHGL
jgi:addiction module RelB/DinJ family antitoxin